MLIVVLVGIDQTLDLVAAADADAGENLMHLGNMAVQLHRLASEAVGGRGDQYPKALRFLFCVEGTASFQCPPPRKAELLHRYLLCADTSWS